MYQTNVPINNHLELITNLKSFVNEIVLEKDLKAKLRFVKFKKSPLDITRKRRLVALSAKKLILMEIF